MLIPRPEDAAYAAIKSDSQKTFQRGTIDVDPYLGGSATDRRQGLALVSFPPASLVKNIQAFLTAAAKLHPVQYVYPPDDLHLTILSLVGGTSDYAAQTIPISDYSAAIAETLRVTGPIEIDFSGVALSPGAIILRGYAANNRLNIWRDHLRTELARRGLDGLLDRRYKMASAHITAVRFQTQPARLDDLKVLAQRFDPYPFGTWRLTRADLVTCDWYMRQHRRTLHRSFDLIESSPQPIATLVSQ